MTGSSSTAEFYDEVAKNRLKFVRRRHAYYDDLQRLLRFILREDGSVVELGCGIGNVLWDLPNKQKTGIDFSRQMIERAKQFDESGTRYKVADMDHLPGGETYDYVLLLDAVNILPDVEQTLLEVRNKLCTDQTRVVITFQNFLWRPFFTLATKLGFKTPALPQNWLYARDVKTLLSLADFEIVRRGERLLCPWAIPLFGPLCNRFLVHLPLIRRLAMVHYMVARASPKERKEESVSIVIPARNEAGNIKRALEQMPTFGSAMEIIFVEGNSTDDTWDVIQQTAESYSGPHKIVATQQDGTGKGDAVRKGFEIATNDILFILDADLTVDPSELPKFYNALVSGKGEFINGSRLVYPMDDKAMQLLNILGNKFFSSLFTWLLNQPLKDTLCGTKVLRRRDYEHINQNRTYFGDFDPFGDFDLLFGAAKQQLKIIEVPIRYRERTYGSTNIRRWYHGWLLLKMSWVAAFRLKFI